ncbi:hypothetical protein, partial [Pseudophaeobacter sp.]|uniref:hypothetical protein n=1 Tax=Pseudophaeobacter sp. TaxID=1971739 RepID=UPI00405954FF
GRGDPDPHRRTQPLYCAWHTRHRARRVNPSGVRGSLHIIRFVQQSLEEASAAARTMQGDAEELAALVSSFKVSAETNLAIETAVQGEARRLAG